MKRQCRTLAGAFAIAVAGVLVGGLVGAGHSDAAPVDAHRVETVAHDGGAAGR